MQPKTFIVLNKQVIINFSSNLKSESQDKAIILKCSWLIHIRSLELKIFHVHDNFHSFLLLREIVLQVTLIARGDVPLSIVMTICTTLGAVILTPLLTKILAGAYVPVNAAGLSISTLQVS